MNLARRLWWDYGICVAILAGGALLTLQSIPASFRRRRARADPRASGSAVGHTGCKV